MEIIRLEQELRNVKAHKRLEIGHGGLQLNTPDRNREYKKAVEYQQSPICNVQ